MASENIGGVAISVDVDLSQLDQKFQAAVSDAAVDGQKIGQAIADGISSGAESGAAAFDAAMQRLVDGGASANEAFQQLTGSTQTFMEALQSGTISEFADSFGRIAEAAQPVADALDQAAQSAKSMADQLSLFGDVGTPFSDMTGQMNLFSDAVEVVASDSKSLSTALSGIGDDAAKIGPALQDASSGAKQYSDAAQSIITSQSQADAKLQEAQSALAEIQAAYEKGAVDADTLARAAMGVQSAFDQANPALAQAKQNTQDASLAAEAAQTAFGGLVSILGALGVSLSLAAFVNFAEDVGTAADSITRANISLTALTGSAETAAGMVEKLNQLGVSDGLAMPSLYQAAVAMTNIVPAGSDVVGILSQIADAAAVTGKSFDTVASAFDRLASGGTTGIRQLLALGINLDSLKTTMNDLGIAAEGSGKQIMAAFNALDVHDKMVVAQTDMLKFQGIAEDTAQNTFGGAWKSAMAQWDADIGIIQKDLGSIIGDLGGSLRSGVTFIAESFVVTGTTIVASIDSIRGSLKQLSVELQAVGQATGLAGSGNFAAAGAVIGSMFAQVAAIEKETQAKIAADWAVGTKIITDLESQKVAAIKPTIDALDHQGQAAKDAGDKMGAAFAAAEASVGKFDAQVLSGDGTVGSLQRAFENASKAINLVAKQDLPTAIKAVTDYNQAMVDAGAKASVLDAGFQEQSKLVGQLAKTDLPGAYTSMAALTKTYLDGAAPIGLVNAAFAETEKYINSLAKTDIPAAITESNAFIDTLASSGAKLTLLTDALSNQQKLWDTLAKTNLPGAIDGLGQLADKAVAIHAPMQEVSNILDDMRSKLDQLAKTNLQGAIDGLDQLADKEVKLKAPTQEVTATLDDERSKLDLLANTNIEAAISGLDRLAQHQIALNQPTQDVTRTLDDERSKLDMLANTNLEAAISGLDRLANEQIKLNQPTQDVTKTLDDERSKIDLLANSNLPAAIQRLSDLADEQVKLNQPTADVTKTLDDERSKIDLLANSNLPAAIQQLSNLADQQVRLNQPTADVTKTLDDERSKIMALGASDVPAAVAALQGLIDKQIALKQPTDDILASIKAEGAEISKLANSDLPAAIAAHQTYIDDLNKENAIYIAINAEGTKTIQQQQFQIASLQQLLASVKDINLAYGDRLAIEAKIAQEEISLGEKQGQNVEAQILGLEKIKLAQESLIISTHGWGDAYVSVFNDVLKGFDQLGSAMGQAIVNGQNLGAALVKEFQKIAASILGDLIQGALQPLKKELVDLIGSLLPSLNTGLNASKGAIDGLAKSATDASDAFPAMTKNANAMSSSMSSFATSLTSWMSAIGAIVGAIAGIVGDVYLAAIDTKLFHIETTELEIRNETQNRRKDAWDQFNQTYTRLGECKNDLDSISDTLKQIQSKGTLGGGGLTATDSSNLQAAAAGIQALLSPLLSIQSSTASIDGWTQAIDNDIANGLSNIEDSLIYAITKLDSIISAIQYGSQKTNDLAQQSLDSQKSSYALQAKTFDALTSGALKPPPNLIPPTTGGPPDRPGGKDPVPAPIGQTPGQATAQDQARLAAAQAQLAVSLTIAGEIQALQGIIQQDNALMNDAIAKAATETTTAAAQADLALANTYRQAAANATSQLLQIENTNAAGFSNINTGMSNQLGKAQDISNTAVGTGQFIITAVGAGAQTISQAVYGAAAQTGAAFGAAIAGLGMGIIPWTPGIPNMPTGPGSGGSGQGAYGAPGYVPPNTGTPYTGPAGNGPGGPLAPFIPGGANPPQGPGPLPGGFWPAAPFNQNPYIGGTQPGTGNQVPNNLPVFAEGGIMPWTGMAHLEAGEVVSPPDVSAMLRRMASTPDMSYTPRNPAASGAVAPGSVSVGSIIFNVSGGSAADNVRQIAAYMKTVSPKLAALSS